MEVKYYDWLEHHEDIRGDKIAIRNLIASTAAASASSF